MLIVGCLVLVAAVAVAFYLLHPSSTPGQSPTGGRSTAMAHVLHHHPADSPGYTRLLLKDPVGTTQASEPVVAHGPATDPAGELVVHTIHLHGQREVDVPTGSIVRFPDGTELHTA